MIFSFAVTHCVAVKCTLHSIHHPRPDMTSFFSFLAPHPLLRPSVHSMKFTSSHLTPIKLLTKFRYSFTIFLIVRWWSGGFKDLCYQRIIQILGGPCLNTCALAVILWKIRETSLTALMQCWCAPCIGRWGERTRVRGTRGAGCSSAAPSPPTGRSGSVSRTGIN